MDRFERENVLHHILGEIEKTDKFYNSFNNELAATLMPILERHARKAVAHPLFGDAIKSFGVAVLNSTESVIDKDRTYPQYRMDEELATMANVVSRLSVNVESLPLAEEVSSAAKALMVKYFIDIYQLSGRGFRLLELNTKLYNWEFLEQLAILIPDSSAGETNLSGE